MSDVRPKADPETVLIIVLDDGVTYSGAEDCRRVEVTWDALELLQQGVSIDTIRKDHNGWVVREEWL